MNITNLKKVPKTTVDMEGAKGVQKQLMISKEHGTPNMSFRLFTLEPHGHTPHHSHPFEHLNYVIEGHGTLFGEDGEHKIKEGDFILVMPDEIHQYRNDSSSQPFIVICAVPKEYE